VAHSVSASAGRAPGAPVVSVEVSHACAGLLELFGRVPGGRSDQGRDHPTAAVLALAAAAVVAGMRSYTAITGWVADVPTGMLDDVYVRAGGKPAGPPSKSTIWRVLTDAGPDAFDAAVGSRLMRLTTAVDGVAPDTDADGDGPAVSMPVRLDGKTLRGAKDAEGDQPHLPAALVGARPSSAVIAARTDVGVKTNEVPMAQTVLDQIDLTGTLVTADALHTVKATAGYIHRRGGRFVLPVRENRRALFDALDALPWPDTPIAHTSTDIGHGRVERRTIQVLPAPEDLPFPHVHQVFLIERYVSDRHGTPRSAVAALGVASPAPAQAGPAELAGYVRGQWAIEALHWIRDTLHQEGASRVRTRSGPRIMASLRNLAIGALRPAGRCDATEATRWAGRYMHRPFTILGLTP
jgi:predicted transposase YbfD/YdcC